ncbi:MAG: right-handed parallel beta-helix repeat-containing protein [Bacteroidota bacterium]
MIRSLAVLLVLLFSTYCGSREIHTTTYYVSAKSGNDSNSGLSPTDAFKTLGKANLLSLKPGDSLLLASNSVFEGGLSLINIHGTKSDPVIITSYPDNLISDEIRPVINAKGSLQGILIENSSFIEISNIEIIADAKSDRSYIVEETRQKRCGLMVKNTEPTALEHIYINNLYIHDIFYQVPGFKRGAKEVRTSNGTQNYGWGIYVVNGHEKAEMSDIRIANTRIENVAHTGIKILGKHESGIRNIEIANNELIATGGPGMMFGRVGDMHIHHNTINRSGDNSDTRKWGRGSGLWTWGSNDVLIEHNRFTNANGPGDSAGAHIDFNCSNVVLQYNFSANNAGGFCEILGNNYNCSYRYNISVNDGFRIKGVDGAFQEGKTFWLSGYVGKGNKRNGPYNSYFYNNTIFVNEDIVSKIAIAKEASGVLISNNIFYVMGSSEYVKGDQYRPEKEGHFDSRNVIFENNLFYSQASWSEQIPIQDIAPLFGNPEFSNPGDTDIKGYIPSNSELIKNKGIPIQLIPDDTIGLKIGLKVEKDILGNEIIDLPDMGAIELNSIK